MKMDVKDSCIFRANWLNAAHKIENPALRCCFFEAVLQYALTGMKTEAPAELNLALEVIYSLIDIDRDKYEKKIEKRREAGKKGMASRWGNHQEETPITNDSKNNKCYQEITNVTNITVTDTVTDTVKDNDFKKEKDNIVIISKESAKARPRDIAEVDDYIKEYSAAKGLPISFTAQYWYDYHVANGWKTGRNSIKDWKAVIRTWFARENKIQKVNGSNRTNNITSGVDRNATAIKVIRRLAAEEERGNA